MGSSGHELDLLLAAALNGGKQFFCKKEGKKGEQKDSGHVDKGEMDALCFYFFI